MENIISTAVSWGGPGGGTHSHYLELYSMGDRYELSVLQDYSGDGAAISGGEIPRDDYSVVDPDGEIGEGACWDDREIVGWDEDGFLQLAGYSSAYVPENYEDVPDAIEFTDTADPLLSVILDYFSMSAEELKKEVEKLEVGGDPVQSEREPLRLVGSTRRGDMETIKRLLGPPAKSSQDELDTALFLAAWQNDLKIIKLLIHAGADVNAVFWNDYLEKETTALMAAESKFCHDAVEALLDAGADPYIQNESQETVFDMDDVLEISEPVEEVKETSGQKTIKPSTGAYEPNEFTEFYADASIEQLIARWNRDKKSHGWVAARGRFRSALRERFENSRNQDGKTLLCEAAEDGHTEHVKFLLDYDTNRSQNTIDAIVNLKDNEGRTPLNWAIKNGHTEIIEILKKAGAKE